MKGRMKLNRRNLVSSQAVHTEKAAFCSACQPAVMSVLSLCILEAPLSVSTMSVPIRKFSCLSWRQQFAISILIVFKLMLLCFLASPLLVLEAPADGKFNRCCKCDLLWIDIHLPVTFWKLEFGRYVTLLVCYLLDAVLNPKTDGSADNAKKKTGLKQWLHKRKWFRKLKRRGIPCISCVLVP